MEQGALLGVLTGAHGAHRREVADEVRRGGDQLDAPMGRALRRKMDFPIHDLQTLEQTTYLHEA